MKRAALAGLVLASATALPVLAQDETDLSKANEAIAGRFYISPMGSHTWEDKKRDTDDGWGGALGIGKQLSRYFSLELSGFYSEFNSGGQQADNLEQWGAGLTALVFPFASGAGQAFYGLVGAHYGEGDNHPSSGEVDYETVFGDAGLGYLFGPFSWLNHGSLRAEARYRMDFHDEPQLGSGNEDEFGDVVANLGFLIPIGAQPQPPPPPEPEPVEVVPVQPPADSDGDGVTDDLDQCPGTPAGEPVDAVGCPLPKAECKTPEPGQPVTLEGCAAGDTIVLRGVNFDFDKSSLTANARTILDSVSEALSTAPTVTVEIGGHTDARGSDEYNQKLSERRAAAVVDYLEDKGVEPARMTSKGYGESTPVADNETDEGRELNRRVELTVTGGTAETTDAAPAETAPAAEEAPAAE
ncbi:OmpA family protein [Panacagrimonas sp.]|uniref:OmpA family protein n=1 Tax=Panacagrimonas sp. TaxID=2480088 RepID=UPI003B518F5A